MGKIFDVNDRQEAFKYILSITKESDKIAALVQVGSGSYGYNDEKSDLDFVIALDSDSSMLDVMDYMYDKIASKYEILYSKKAEASHLLVMVLSNLLEIDLGFGGYEHAAARKPDYKVLFDKSGVVEDKMVQSRAWMDEQIYGNKQKSDIENACNTVWAHMMHAAVAIYRNNYFRAIGELEFIRRVYIDLLGDRYRLESGCNHDIDKLPKEVKEDIKSTLVYSENADDLWKSLLNITSLVYRELEGNEVPISQENLLEYYKDIGYLRKADNVKLDQIHDRYNKITKGLINKKLSITTMESCTAGFIASLITDTEGSSEIMKGAFVTYCNEAKIMQNVPKETIEEYGVYSLQTASAMAEACKKTYMSDIGIGITGSFSNIDTANKGSKEGLVYYAISNSKETKVYSLKIDSLPTRFDYKLAVADAIADRLNEYI